MTLLSALGVLNKALLDAVLAEIDFCHFHLEMVRDQVRYNLGDIWPNLAIWGLHRPYLYMITNIQVNFEAMRPNFRDLTRGSLLAVRSIQACHTTFQFSSHSFSFGRYP